MNEESSADYRLQAENTKLHEQNTKLTREITKLRKRSVLVPILNSKISELSKDLEYHQSLWNKDVLRRGGDARYMHGQELLNAAMADPRMVQFATHMSADEIEYTYCRVEKAVRTDGSKLFYENGDPRPGNRCRLTVRQSVFVSIAHKAGAIRQTDLEMMLGVSQPTISRCMAHIDPLLDGELPTAQKVQEVLRDASEEDLKELVPENIIIPDGTETPIQRSKDRDVQREFYSGKKKRHTVKNTIICNMNQLILYLGPAHTGKTHDMNMLRKDDPDLGPVTSRSKSKDTPADKQMLILSDLGYKKIQDVYPGARHKQPHKKIKDVDLTKRQKQDNRAISRRRVRVENAIGKVKRYRILGSPFDGTVEKFSLTMSIITGLANLKTLWNHKKKRPKREF